MRTLRWGSFHMAQLKHTKEKHCSAAQPKWIIVVTLCWQGNSSQKHRHESAWLKQKQKTAQLCYSFIFSISSVTGFNYSDLNKSRSQSHHSWTVSYLNGIMRERKVLKGCWVQSCPKKYSRLLLIILYLESCVVNVLVTAATLLWENRWSGANLESTFILLVSE